MGCQVSYRRQVRTTCRTRASSTIPLWPETMSETISASTSTFIRIIQFLFRDATQRQGNLAGLIVLSYISLNDDSSHYHQQGNGLQPTYAGVNYTNMSSSPHLWNGSTKWRFRRCSVAPYHPSLIWCALQNSLPLSQRSTRSCSLSPIVDCSLRSLLLASLLYINTFCQKPTVAYMSA